jgi:predicted amidophosphoribosyltransferase
MDIPGNLESAKVHLLTFLEEKITMICPGCGADNPDESGMCSACGYKFRFGYAFDDPKKMRFLDFSRFKIGKQKAAGIFLVSLSIIILALIIFTCIKSICNIPIH